MDARLIGVEYMIPIERFKKLPEQEKRYWHSHLYKIKSGLRIMPKPAGVSADIWEAQETKTMEGLSNWLCKTYHFWQIDRGDELPLGEPGLMMSLVRDGQINAKDLQDRDSKCNISSECKKEIRKAIALPTAPAGCDHAYGK